MVDVERLERRRLILQDKLDVGKAHAERNRMGQFPTPTALAREILRTTVALLPPKEPIKFLDPAIGTGAFWTALLATVPEERILSAVGFDVDPYYADPAQKLLTNTPLDYRVADFGRVDPDHAANLIICNPPYIRATRIPREQKRVIWSRTGQVVNIQQGKNAGMYCHFMWLAHRWMTPGGVSAWLIPSEFMATRYGKAMKHYLLRKVTLLGTYRFDPNDTQFPDANITSIVLWLKNETPSPDHVVTFGFGGTLDNPRQSVQVTGTDLIDEPNWTRFPKRVIRTKLDRTETIENFFRINHGYNFRHMRHLVMSMDQIDALGLPHEFFRPILPKPKYVHADIIEADEDGVPLLARQPFLFVSTMSERGIRKHHPEVVGYLNSVKAMDRIGDDLQFPTRPWYAQIKINEHPTRFIATHFGRLNPRQGRPPRFLLNRSSAIISYPYLEMHPIGILAQILRDDPSLVDKVFEVLQTIPRKVFMTECHLLGGGLCKVEPFALYRMKIPGLRDILPSANDLVSNHLRVSMR